MIGARLLPLCVGPIEQELPFHPERGRSSHENSRGNEGMFQGQIKANTEEFSSFAIAKLLWNDPRITADPMVVPFGSLLNPRFPAAESQNLVPLIH